MNMHHHDHHHGPVEMAHITNAFYIGIGLNVLFTVIEFVFGYYYNSLALLADASHNLSDVASLIIALIALKISNRAATIGYTYGYKRASILASFINSIILILVVIGIFKEAIERLSSAPTVIGEIIILTAFIGVLINSASAFLFLKGQKEDINIRGAYLHLIVDAIVSLGVVVSGIIIYYTDLYILDPLISIIIAVVILMTTWSLFKESLKLILDGVPKGIDIDEIRNLALKYDEVKDIVHIHIWAISSSQNALSAHVILNDSSYFDQWMTIKTKIKQDIKSLNIQHITLELDQNNESCDQFDCQ